MAAWSPTLEGFRSVFRRPSLPLAEVMWRWSFGAAACVLLGLAFLEYLNTLPVSNTDVMLLRTGHPLLVSRAFAHILHGSALRVVIVSVILFSGLAVLWVLLASLGRGATLAALLEYIRQRASAFRRDTASDAVRKTTPEVPSEAVFPGWHMRSLVGLHFLRVSLALTACAALIGGVIIASFSSSKAHPHPGMVFLLCNMILLLIWLLWSSVSWFLSTAAIFVVREGEDTFGALSATAGLFREHLGPVMAVGTWFGIAHLVLFVVAASVVSFPLAFAQIVPPGIVLIAMLLLGLAYFAIVDALYVGRFAGYAAILEAPPPPPPAPAVPPLEPAPGTPYSTFTSQPEPAMVDQDETILSDTPMRADTDTNC